MTHATVLSRPRAATPWSAALNPSRQARTFTRWFLILVLAGLGSEAFADENVTFYLQPADSTVVVGHVVTFLVETDCKPAGAEYQWYRNDVAIPGATKQFYRLTATSADNGARYRVDASGYRDKITISGSPEKRPAMASPMSSRQATLTVLPAGSSLPPKITAPNRATLIYPVDTYGIQIRFAEFHATGNNLEWTYRYDNEDVDVWHLMPSTTIGAQALRFDFSPTPTTEGGSQTASSSLIVRVTDDAGVAATRTWQLTEGTWGDLQDPGLLVFSGGPSDSTVVAGHRVAFLVNTNITKNPVYQWYRNDVAIAGATANPYTFVAQASDASARYHVVASGEDKLEPLGQAASPKATLTVLPAGSSLPPQIVAPAGDKIYLLGTQGTVGFRASGNNLAWAYRYNTDAAGSWRALDASTTGCPYVRISFDIWEMVNPSVSVRVTDDARVAAIRTWAFVKNNAPRIWAVNVVGPNPVRWPGPTTLSVDAEDTDGDPLTYRWSVDYANSVPLGEAVFTPSGNTCSVTFTKFGYYFINVVALDGKDGVAQLLSRKIIVEPNFDVRADVNQDGVINGLDHGIVSDNFGKDVP